MPGQILPLVWLRSSSVILRSKSILIEGSLNKVLIGVNCEMVSYIFKNFAFENFPILRSPWSTSPQNVLA